MIPGEYRLASDPILCNGGRATVEIDVTNTGDRPIQVGSHYHFFETNPALVFDRAAARRSRWSSPTLATGRSRSARTTTSLRPTPA